MYVESEIHEIFENDTRKQGNQQPRLQWVEGNACYRRTRLRNVSAAVIEVRLMESSTRLEKRLVQEQNHY